MKCYICPRMCGADREQGEKGVCGCTDKIRVARAEKHFWEEPPISYKNGSGTVFFSGCNLGCIFCQNHAISAGDAGKEIDGERLYEIFCELKEKGAHNINLVTPTHFTRQIIPVLQRAKSDGFTLPILWNSGGYELNNTIEGLKGLVDIYLPDFKYMNEATARRYSGAADYPIRAKQALEEMIRQVSTPIIHRGTMRKGVIVRHLVLPDNIEESKSVIEYLHKAYGDSLYISIMNQYTPTERVKSVCPELDRTVTEREYGEVVEFALKLGVKNAFIQEGGAVGESFIPVFDNRGV